MCLFDIQVRTWTLLTEYIFRGIQSLTNNGLAGVPCAFPSQFFVSILRSTPPVLFSLSKELTPPLSDLLKFPCDSPHFTPTCCSRGPPLDPLSTKTHRSLFFGRTLCTTLYSFFTSQVTLTEFPPARSVPPTSLVSIVGPHRYCAFPYQRRLFFILV